MGRQVKHQRIAGIPVLNPKAVLVGRKDEPSRRRAAVNLEQRLARCKIDDLDMIVSAAGHIGKQSIFVARRAPPFRALEILLWPESADAWIARAVPLPF